MGEFHEVLLLLFSWSLLLFSRLQMNTSFSQHMLFYFYRIKRVVLESENASAQPFAIARSFFARSFFARLSGIR